MNSEVQAARETGSAPPLIVRRGAWLVLLLLWGLATAYSLRTHLDDLRQQSIAIATENAREMFRMIVLTRSWAAAHGGVYVPITAETQPNPYIQSPRRDLVTTDGTRLTLINPAYMTRQISELVESRQGSRFHITSLKPIRPANGPDDWERRALQAFERGRQEISELLPAEAGGGQRLRYMAPLQVTEPCLECHAEQGYKLGDIRGGISVSQMFDPIEQAGVPARKRSILAHLVVFVLVAVAGGMLLNMLRARWLGLAESVAALSQARRELETANRTLREARDSAETANIAKSAFLANMSHEIRTPLNAITGMAHLIRRGGLQPKQAGQMEKLETASRHLLKIINSILDLSKIEAGKFVLEESPIRLESIVGNVLSMLRDAAQAKGLALRAELDPLPDHLLGDPTRLQQAWLNYAANALKFTESGEVLLQIGLIEQDDTGVLLRFAVVDSGIGIAEEALPRLFNAFEQADNSMTRQYGGTGLGLAITRKIAELMGGTAGAESTLGRGSTFWFTARLKRGPANGTTGERHGAAPAGQAADFGNCRILLVEDEPINREIAAEILQELCQVDVAEDGLQAVELAARQDYALILMDMQMPRLDGLEATRRIRAQPRGRATPIIAMTANAFVEDRERCLAAGMDDFIAKPVDPGQLGAMLRKWLAPAFPAV